MKKSLLLILSLFLSCSAVSQEQKIVDAPVFNIFELAIKQGQAINYDKVAKDNITASLDGEEGTLAMYSVKHKTHPEMAYMIEIYANDGAYKKHVNSTKYKYFLSRSPEILQSDRKRQIKLAPQFLGDKKVVQDKAMINNLVIVDVKPAFNQAFRDVVIPEMVQSLKVEEGVIAMYAATEKSNPTRWYFYEIYASEDAYQAHRKTPHFQEYLAKTSEMTSYKEAIPIAPGLLMNKGGLQFIAH